MIPRITHTENIFKGFQVFTEVFSLFSDINWVSFLFTDFFKCFVEDGLCLNTTYFVEFNVPITFQPSLACLFTH